MNRSRGIGWEVLHVAIDDASRLAYTELHPDEKMESACPFFSSALAFFKAHGIAVASCSPAGPSLVLPPFDRTPGYWVLARMNSLGERILSPE